MLRKIKKVLDRRKVKIFLIFLLCSSFLWFLSKLSEPYTSNTVFNIEYHNVPDSLLLASVSKENINVRLKASGFNFLGFNFNPKKIFIDLSSVTKKGNLFFVPQQVYQNQIENQLPNSMQLSGIDRDTLFFKFHKVLSKQVPIRSKVAITLAQNYLLENLKITPDSIIIKGPQNEIDTVQFVTTETLSLEELTSDFLVEVPLKKGATYKNTIFSKRVTTITGAVFRFSEKIIKTPVQVINLPEGVKIKTFPAEVPILCRGKINELKSLNVSNFKVVADYNGILTGNTTALGLQLLKKPNQIYSAELMENQVEYILKRE